MAYNVAANLRQTRPGAAFMAGRDNALRNALNERDMQLAEGNQQFSQQNALMQRERQARMDEAAAQQQEQAAQIDERKQLLNAFSHLDRAYKVAPDQAPVISQQLLNSQLFRKYNLRPEDLTPESIATRMPVLAAEAGVAPAEEPVRFEQMQGPRGAVLQRDPRTGEMKQIVGPDNSQPSPASQAQWRALTPQEIAAAGLPPGTSAQTDGSGKIDVLSKRDSTGGLSQKDMTTARMKINSVQLAKQQLQAIKDRFQAGTRGADFFGPVAGYAATPAGKSFDAAVDQMRSTLTALTRVPGVGAMSDYETRLDQAKFPVRTDWESVTAQKIQGIEDMLTTIENGYKDLLTGAQSVAQPAAPSGGQGGPVRVNTPEEAAALPSGTEFITPDGRRKVRP